MNQEKSVKEIEEIQKKTTDKFYKKRDEIDNSSLPEKVKIKQKRKLVDEYMFKMMWFANKRAEAIANCFKKMLQANKKKL